MKDIKQNVISLFEEMIGLAGEGEMKSALLSAIEFLQDSEEGEMKSALLSAIGFLQDEEFFDEED